MPSTFVHLHNHSDFSILDAATRIDAMVKRAVDLGMPAIALTDHGYMFGIPNFDLACRKYNDAQKDMHQWKHDVECFQKGWELEEPEPDAPDAALHDQVHAQWESDVAIWERTGDLDAVKANKPSLTIKPIFGCEAYFITDDQIERGTKQRRYHLILLAKNETGYVNLMKMMSQAANEMYYYKPRTTLDMLKRYHEGIICQSACVQGIIPQRIIDGDLADAERWIEEYKSIFGEDFYMEIQEHGNTFRNGFTDRSLDEEIVRLARKHNVKLVATNDIHYLTREDAPTQDILSCIGTASRLDEPNRKHMEGTEYYLKTEEEMRELFSWCPEACDNTLEIADKCGYELDWTHMYLPKFPLLKEGETSEQRFRKECEAGLAKRYGENWRDVGINGINVQDRFEYEYKIICDKGFADYFLIVQEYVQWAKDNGIGVGPGRGSAAGALVAYAMNITTFDPLENGLMFERFLSPQRSEMPDIDMDFDDERRLDVVQHVRELYGPERVCHVITYSTIKAKQAINDANRVLGYPPYMGQNLSKMVSGAPGVELKNVLAKKDGKEDQFSPDFTDAYQNDPDAKRVIDAALSIEGLTRGEGVHACAVLIAPTPVNDHVPTKLDTKGGVEITQYEGHSVADMGLLKMDFLGLRTLTVISKALANIRANYATAKDRAAAPKAVKAALKDDSTFPGIDIDVDKVPFDDPKIYELMGRGHTAGVFQIESAGMTATIKGMQPKEYRQVVALIALYRPGPLGAGMVTDYIDRMNGRKKVVYYDDRLSDILEETYGTIVYQEQVMQISMKMSGFSAGESDKVRKAVAKKKSKLMTETIQHWDDGNDETMQDHWMNGAVRNGYPRETAERIWADVLKFASYAFNKSHSAGYAILVMQTAWLKAYFPREYMASVLTSYMGKTEKIVHYISACRAEGIDVLPPDINESGKDFTATSEGVRFGFAGIRGVGEGVAQVIIAERDANGPFKTLHDFVDRMDSTQANRRVVEALIKSGAFDSTGYTRRHLMRMVDEDGILESAAKRQREQSAGQESLFDLFGDDAESGFADEIPEPDGIEWERLQKLAYEKEVLGIYVSDHPLAPFKEQLAAAADVSIAAVLDKEDDDVPAEDEPGSKRKGGRRKMQHFAGMISGLTPRVTKKGDMMATFSLEDMDAAINCVVFPKAYQQYRSQLVDDGIVRVLGRVDQDDRGMKLMVSEVEKMDLDEEAVKPHRLELLMRSAELSQHNMDLLSNTLARYGGKDPVVLFVSQSDGRRFRAELPLMVNASSNALYSELVGMFGRDGVRVAVG